ncbi:MAG: class I SAM-dependent methyltransferase [Thermoleophilaceae bacterium]|nr:class I SAM-dependent methyltransferase [Thermoleophilaceae bacterium]
MARDRRRVDRPHGRGRSCRRRGPRRAPHQQPGARGRLPGRARCLPQARRRRDRQHRRRQPVRRRRHPQAAGADPRGPRRHGHRRPRDRSDRAFLTREEAAPALGQRGRAARLGHACGRHDLGVPRLQPRGGAPDPGGLEVHLHARVDHPGGQDAGGGRPRPDQHQPEDARVAPVPLDGGLRTAQRGVDLPHLRPLRAPAAVPRRGHVHGRDRGRHLGALLLVRHSGRQRRPRPVPDPGIDAIHRRGAVRGARRGGRHPGRLACAAAANPRAGAARGVAPGRGAVALRARRPPDRPRAHHRRPGRPRDRQDRRSGGAEAVSATADVPTGNTFDKYGSSNPVVKRLMTGFHSTLDELWAQAAPRSILDVGCGEGVLTAEWAERLGDGRIVGIDLDDPKLRADWERRSRPNLEFRVEEATSLSFAEGEFDMACAIEVLEHVPEPEATLAEMARVASGHLLVSVPREPLWRGLNVARGSYLRVLGNTPGHVNHWSKRAFVALLSRYGTVEEARSPFPWTMVLVRL